MAVAAAASLVGRALASVDAAASAVPLWALLIGHHAGTVSAPVFRSLEGFWLLSLVASLVAAQGGALVMQIDREECGKGRGGRGQGRAA